MQPELAVSLEMSWIWNMYLELINLTCVLQKAHLTPEMQWTTTATGNSEIRISPFSKWAWYGYVQCEVTWQSHWSFVFLEITFNHESSWTCQKTLCSYKRRDQQFHFQEDGVYSNLSLCCSKFWLPHYWIRMAKKKNSHDSWNTDHIMDKTWISIYLQGCERDTN